MQRDELTIKVNKCQQGDPEAFSWLVSEYGPRLYRYFHRHSGSAQEAEDLLQDMFVKLVEKIRDYRHQGLFEAWLFRVAANLSRDRARRGQKRISRAVSLNASQDGQGSLIDTLESAEKTASKRLENKEQIDQLGQALNQLGEQEREIILLRHYGSLSFKEISEQLGIPIGTALTRVHRGLKHLQRIMNDG